MLPKENRLKLKKDFETVFRKGKSFNQDILLLKVLENDSNIKRFGFIVSRKISKKAVMRNKIKRRLREAVGARLKKARDGVDCVLVALPGIEKKDFADIEKSVDNLLGKAKIIETKGPKNREVKK